MRTPLVSRALALSSLALALAITAANASSQLATASARSAPAPLAWKDVSRVAFDLQWRLPRQPGGMQRDLVARLKLLASERFSPEPTAKWMRSLGDAVGELSPLSPRERNERFATMRKQAPHVWKALGATLTDLLNDEWLASDDWDPSETSAADGFLDGAVVDMKKESDKPWSELDGASELYQAATLMDADIASIKAAENDYDAYLRRRHAGYEEVYRVGGSYRSGAKPDGQPFAVIKVYFRCDLPFPFGGYDGTLNVMSQLDTDGHLVTDFYCTGDDFYWMAGRDTCIPLADSDGNWVTTLVVRQAGFDLSGVPDGDGERAASCRGILGNVKILAEKIDRSRKTPPLTSGAIPHLP